MTIDERRECWMNPMRDKNKTPVTTAYPEGRRGKNLVRVEAGKQKKRDGSKTEKNKKKGISVIRDVGTSAGSVTRLTFRPYRWPTSWSAQNSTPSGFCTQPDGVCTIRGGGLGIVKEVYRYWQVLRAIPCSKSDLKHVVTHLHLAGTDGTVQKNPATLRLKL